MISPLSRDLFDELFEQAESPCILKEEGETGGCESAAWTVYTRGCVDSRARRPDRTYRPGVNASLVCTSLVPSRHGSRDSHASGQIPSHA
jgi:hypothetical protein